MKTKTNHLIAAALILLSGCVAYYPQVVDVPLIKEKGDVRLNTGYFIVPNFPELDNVKSNRYNENETEWLGNIGGHISVSAGITDLLSIQGYLSLDVAARFHFQPALGVYHVLNDKTVMEFYGGCGWGNGYMNTLFHLRDNYLLPFTQFNIGQTGISAARIDYGLGLKSGYIFSEHADYIYSSHLHQQNGWIVEPSVFFRVGGRRAKFNMTICYLWTKTISDLYYFPLSIGMGVNLSLGKLQ